MKPYSPAAASAVLLLSLGLGGCHAMRFNVSSAEHDKVVEERKSYFLWGLLPTQEIDVSTRCAAGVSSIKEETTFTDGLLGTLTLGIWEPRSSWYYCLPVQKQAAR